MEPGQGQTIETAKGANVPVEAAAAHPHPLGLPPGSVRAILALLIVAVVVGQSLQGQAVGILWTQALMIALAHYFTSRRFVEMPDELLRRLQSENLIEDEPNPLYLPRHTIRLLIVAIFVTLAILLFRQGRLWEPGAMGLLINVFSYFFGILWRAILKFAARGRASPASRRWRDLKAWTVLGALGLVAGLHLLGVGSRLPEWVDDSTIALVLFYFGSR